MIYNYTATNIEDYLAYVINWHFLIILLGLIVVIADVVYVIDWYFLIGTFLLKYRQINLICGKMYLAIQVF